jgi:apolipoprotein N-acyltransferase
VNSSRIDGSRGVDLQALRAESSPSVENGLCVRLAAWNSPILFGVIDVRDVTELKYGVQVVQEKLVNSAVLLQPAGSCNRQILDYYIKRGLVPFRELIPAWVPYLGLTEFVQEATSQQWSLHPGNAAPHFALRSASGDRPFGVSICYELFQPQLESHSAQGSVTTKQVGCVIHLCSEEAFSRTTEIYAWQKAAAIRRAMLSDCWQIVANKYGESFVVSPKGDVCAHLPSGSAGLILREDGTASRITLEHFSGRMLDLPAQFTHQPMSRVR